MSTQYPAIPGNASTPPAYQWILRWEAPAEAGDSTKTIGFFIVLCLWAVAAKITFGAWAGHIPAGFAVFFDPIALFIPLTLIFGKPSAVIEQIDQGVLLRYRMRNDFSIVVLPVVIAMMTGITLVGIDAHLPALTVVGAVLVTVCVVIGVLGFARQRPLVLTTDYLALGDRWRIPWEQVVVLRGRTTADRNQQPYISFRIHDPSTYSKASDRRYTLRPKAWNQDANALFSTLTFMVENSDARRTVTPAQLEAMLTAPYGPRARWTFAG
ncbi:hypothetical protein [Nocardia sp. NBC_01327]|uniref:hypothetical protein n=1 Tax=Nocardia sp. NBC_01327 TaxID=2903593 RepID=UPI002E117C3C|nr:hypothetical protein OG326_07840 [Nocardia sp. NBC_01327]